MCLEDRRKRGSVTSRNAKRPVLIKTQSDSTATRCMGGSRRILTIGISIRFGYRASSRLEDSSGISRLITRRAKSRTMQKIAGRAIEEQRPLRLRFKSPAYFKSGIKRSKNRSWRRRRPTPSWQKRIVLAGSHALAGRSIWRTAIYGILVTRLDCQIVTKRSFSRLCN